MDSDLFCKCVLLAVKFGVTYICYKTYERNADRLKTLKMARHFEIDSKLQKEVERNDGIIEYAVISGSIKASTLLKSQYISNIRGVMKDKVIIEHKVKWIPFLGSWYTTNHLSHIKNDLPFVLASKTSGLLQKQVCVEVVDPLTAQEIILPIVYDKFTSYSIRNSNISFADECTKGFQEVERMLCEDMTLTAVGRLVIENNELKIKAPDNTFKYFLTPLRIESLIDKVYDETRKSKIKFIIMGTLTFTFFMYISWHIFAKIKKKIMREHQKMQLEEQRKLRMVDRPCKLQDSHVPKCIICLDYPVEVVILKCGHASLCFSCSKQCEDCPVCRNPIVKTVRAFWP